MINEKEIMYDSPEAARKGVLMIDGMDKAIPVFISSNNRPYSDEAMARYDSHTHKICDCGNKMGKGWTKCESCRRIASNERYAKMPFQEWDGKTMVCIYGDDKYFRDADEVQEYCEDSEIEPESLQLVICKPNYLTPVDTDLWDDVMPEDGDGELPKEVQAALDALNKVISEAKPISYSEGEFRTNFKSEGK